MHRFQWRSCIGELSATGKHYEGSKHNTPHTLPHTKTTPLSKRIQLRLSNFNISWRLAPYHTVQVTGKRRPMHSHQAPHVSSTQSSTVDRRCKVMEHTAQSRMIEEPFRSGHGIPKLRCICPVVSAPATLRFQSIFVYLRNYAQFHPRLINRVLEPVTTVLLCI